jgi:hypothetical protein
MDSKELITLPPPHSSLPDNDNVFRIVEKSHRDKKNKSIPSVSCFSLSQNDKDDGYKLSVNWAALISPEHTLAIVGLSYKSGKEEFKNYRNKEIYSLNVQAVKNIENIIDVVYDPIVFPEKVKGFPSNRSHSSILINPVDFEKNEPEIILKLRDYAAENYVMVDEKIVDSIIEEYQ